MLEERRDQVLREFGIIGSYNDGDLLLAIMDRLLKLEDRVDELIRNQE